MTECSIIQSPKQYLQDCKPKQTTLSGTVTLCHLSCPPDVYRHRTVLCTCLTTLFSKPQRYFLIRKFQTSFMGYYFFLLLNDFRMTFWGIWKEKQSMLTIWIKRILFFIHFDTQKIYIIEVDVYRCMELSYLF